MPACGRAPIGDIWGSRMIFMHNTIRQGALWAAALIALSSLSACLPESEAERARKLSQFLENEAPSYATALTSFAMSSQDVISAALKEGASLTQGQQSAAGDAKMAYGYCQDASAESVNHMMVAWFTTANRSGRFSVKGLGEGAGPGIVNVMAQGMMPESVGFYNDGQIMLRGARANGSSRMGLPAGCSLPIPGGSPVVVAENINAVNAGELSNENYVYRTVPCDDEQDIGVKTERCLKSGGETCHDQSAGWQTDAGATSCNGNLGVRTVTFSDSSQNLVGALGLDVGYLQGALNDLSDVRCVRAAEEQRDEDAQGDQPRDEARSVDTCVRNDVEVVAYEGAGLLEDSGIEESREGITISCGAGRTGVVPEGDGDNTVSYSGYRGPLNLGSGWQGQASYARVTNYADEVSGSAQASTLRGRWVGTSINCTRAETLTLSCSDIFPQYGDTSVYTPVETGGIVMARTNRINEWADPVNLQPGSPLGPTTGWTVSAANCAWEERETFDECPALSAELGAFNVDIPTAMTATQEGIRKRTISATTDFGEVTTGEWETEQPLQCMGNVTDVLPCDTVLVPEGDSLGGNDDETPTPPTPTPPTPPTTPGIGDPGNSDPDPTPPLADPEPGPLGIGNESGFLRYER